MSTPLLGPVFTAAESYAAAGLSVIPIKPDGSKKPVVAWKEYQSRIAGPEQRSDWWANGGGYGIAVICGAVSGNVEAIDFDDIDAFNQWSAMVKELDLELGKRLVIAQTPGPGFQCLFRCVTGPPGNTVLARGSEGQTLIETRGEGGYVLVSPSPLACHPRHKPYSLVKGSLTALPVLDEGERALLMACASTLTAAVLPDQRVGRVLPASSSGDRRPGDDYSVRGDWAELLQRHGWQRTGTRGEVEEWTRPGKTEKGHSATLHAVAPGWFYVFSTGAAPFAPDRAYSLFTAYALLEHDGDFTAAARALAALGYGTPHAASREREPVVLAESLDPARRPWSNAPELLGKKLQPLKWVVPGILPEGLTIFGGRPKQGKSWGLLGIGIAVASGGKAFGKIAVESGSVLYLALEDGERRLQERMRSILKDVPAPDAFDWALTWPGLAVPGQVPSRENPDCLSQMQWWLDEHPDARLVVADTFQKLKRQGKTGANGNAYEEDYATMAPLHRLAVDRRIGLVLCTHTRKPASGSAKASLDFLDEIQGSTGVTGSADTIIGLQKTREDQQVCLSVRGRDVDEQDYLIEWDRDTCDWVLLGPAQQHRATELRQAILQCLTASTTALHYREVAARIGKSGTREVEVVKMTLWRMSGQQQVITTGEGRYLAIKRDDRQV